MVTSITVILVVMGLCLLLSSVFMIVPSLFLGFGIFDFKRRRKLKKGVQKPYMQQ